MSANEFLKSKKIELDKNQVKAEKKLSAVDFIYEHHDFLNAKISGAKEFIKDGAKVTGKGIKTTGTAIHHGVVTSRKRGAEAIAQYTPDIYDKQDDVATGSLKSLTGLGVQGSRTALRTKRSAQNHLRHLRATSLGQQENEILLQIKDLELRQSNGENVGTEIQELKNQLRDIRHNRQLQYSKIKKEKGLQLGVSFKRSASNQFRKGIGSIASKDDFGSKTFGKSLQSVYYINRHKRSIKTVARLVSSIISAIVGVITSIPAIIAALVSILPILLIAIAILAVLLNFIDLSVSGRVSVLADNVYTLNELYDVNIEPEYVLAISQELGWTSGDIKDYERLYSFMLDQKKGKTPSFDQMINNVFEKYNPLNSYLKGYYNRDEYTVYVFHSNTGLDVIGTNTQKISVGEFVDLYPKYRDHYEEESEKFNIDDIRKRCYDSLSYNQEMYLKYMSTLQSGFCAGKSETGNAIAQKALEAQGCLYYWGGSGEVKNSSTYPSKKDKVFDCSGLVYWAHTQEGVQMGRSTANMYGKMGKAVKKEELQAGDIITFDWDRNGIDDHIVIFIGYGNVVGAEGEGSGTYANDLDQCVKTWKLATKKDYISKMRRLY